MRNYRTNAELKQEAKDMLRSRWKEAVLMHLVPSLILFALAMLIFLPLVWYGVTRGSFSYGWTEQWSNGNGGGGGTGGSGGAGGLFTALITTGISFAYLDAYRNPGYRFQPLKDGFRVFRDGNLIPVVFIYIISFFFTFLWSLLLIIPGIIKSIAYSQAYLIYKDRSSVPSAQSVSALDCITESKLLMKGHKGRYFLLQLSFIGWILLGILTFGIGFLWISPYMTATNTAFYNDLVGGPFN